MRFVIFNLVVATAIAYLVTGGSLRNVADDPAGEVASAVATLTDTAKRVGAEARDLTADALSQSPPLVAAPLPPKAEAQPEPKPEPVTARRPTPPPLPPQAPQALPPLEREIAVATPQVNPVPDPAIAIRAAEARAAQGPLGNVEDPPRDFARVPSAGVSSADPEFMTARERTRELNRLAEDMELLAARLLTQ